MTCTSFHLDLIASSLPSALALLPRPNYGITNLGQGAYNKAWQALTRIQLLAWIRVLANSLWVGASKVEPRQWGSPIPPILVKPCLEPAPSGLRVAYYWQANMLTPPPPPLEGCYAVLTRPQQIEQYTIAWSLIWKLYSRNLNPQRDNKNTIICDHGDNLYVVFTRFPTTYISPNLSIFSFVHICVLWLKRMEVINGLIPYTINAEI